jgi:hypothetical protein
MSTIVSGDARTSDWAVLLVSSGSAQAALARGVVGAVLAEHGLAVETWDRPGYRAEPGIDPLEACVRRARAAAITVALLDWEEGSELPWDRLTEGTRRWLIEAGIIHPSPAVARSVTQVEVLAAIATGRPVVILVPDGLMREAEAELRHVGDVADSLVARENDAPDAAALIDEAKYLELLGSYTVPAGRLSLRQAAFLSELRVKVFLQTYNVGDSAGLGEAVKRRIVTLGTPPQGATRSAIERRLRRKRNPLDSRSLLDLNSLGLLVPPPYHAESGSDLLGGKPLWRPNSDSGVLDELVSGGRNVLLLAEPGTGKTTTALLAASSMAAPTSAGTTPVLFISARNRPAAPDDYPIETLAEDWLREELGALQERAPWPGPLPQERMRLIIDGLDESAFSNAETTQLLQALSGFGSLLATCRRADYKRGLHSIAGLFDVIIDLDAWTDEELRTYAEALRSSGCNRAADYIDRQGATERSLLTLPFWLACLVYLAERTEAGQFHEVDDYELLMNGGELLATEECRAGELGDAQAPALASAWGAAAWADNAARRRGETLEVASILAKLGISGRADWSKAVLSQIEVQDGYVLGFHHDVFRDYWLAHHLANTLTNESASLNEIGTLLAVQRTPLANRLIRGKIGANAAFVATRLMAAFEVATDVWAQNQILYLLGRIDHSPASQDFLRMAWQESGPLFVRYSAAWAGSLAGDEVIEAEFFVELSSRGELDALNRGYHRLYYEDSRLASVQVPTGDDGGAADNAMSQLVRRLSDDKAEHRVLRRVEVFTLLRFFETRADVALSTVDDTLRLLDEGITGPEAQVADIERLSDALRLTVAARRSVLAGLPVENAQETASAALNVSAS